MLPSIEKSKTAGIISTQRTSYHMGLTNVAEFPHRWRQEQLVAKIGIEHGVSQLLNYRPGVAGIQSSRRDQVLDLARQA